MSERTDCARFWPEKGPRLECGGLFVEFSSPPDGSIHGWCMFCGKQYSVPPEDAAEFRKRKAEREASTKQQSTAKPAPAPPVEPVEPVERAETPERELREAVLSALSNSGIDTTCGACVEVAFTGVTTNAHDCQQQAALPPPAREEEDPSVEAKYRRLLWAGHGCLFAALYGDDGEMQCGACRVDFKRDPLVRLEAVWTEHRERLFADAFKTPPPAREPVRRIETRETR